MTCDFADDFADFGGVTYLNCAFQGPMPLVSAAAAEEALQLKKTPNLIRDEHYFSYPDSYRQAVADLIACDAQNIAVTDSATHGVLLLVNGLDWQPGDEVVLPQGEFPANRFPWLSLERRGVTVHEVAIGRDLEGIEAAINERTRVVAASWVSYSSGALLDIQALSELCRDRGVLFAVDGTQGVGGLELRLPELRCDLLACAGYKWLLGPYGLGFAYVAPELGERLEPGLVNWFAIDGARDFNRLSECDLTFVPGARRFDMNEAASFVNVASGVASLRYLERVGVATVERHVRELIERLLAGLPSGFREASAAPSGSRSNIVCISGPSDESTEVAAEALLSNRFFLSRREGAIRISPHLFNSVEQIDRVLETLEASTRGASIRVAAGGFDTPLGQALPQGSPARPPERRELEGEGVRLRPVDADRDLEGLFAASHGSPERDAVWTYFAVGPFRDRDELREHLRGASRTDDPLFFTVIAKDSETAVGMTAFQRADLAGRSIEVGHIWYDPDRQRTRLNTETIYLLLEEAFERLGYRRVEWKCDSLNRRSRSAALRLGFRFEGIFRQHMIVKGRNRDTAWFAMLDREWEGVKTDMERWLEASGELSLTRMTQRRQATARLGA